MIGKSEASAEEMRLAESTQLNHKRTEEIHLIITYPIMKSWERLNCVDSVRHKTIAAVKDLIDGFWPGAKVEET